jgi:hypothetical protein
MKKYIRKFNEEGEEVKLEDVGLVDKLFAWFKENPYPQDHTGVHKFAESLGLEADVVETYICAIVSCFVSGGNFNKSGKKAEDFDPEEIRVGLEIESEHVDKDNDNPVVKRICELFEKRISLDHLVESEKYYTKLKEMEASFKK